MKRLHVFFVIVLILLFACNNNVYIQDKSGIESSNDSEVERVMKSVTDQFIDEGKVIIEQVDNKLCIMPVETLSYENLQAELYSKLEKDLGEKWYEAYSGYIERNIRYSSGNFNQNRSSASTGWMGINIPVYGYISANAYALGGWVPVGIFWLGISQWHIEFDVANKIGNPVYAVTFQLRNDFGAPIYWATGLDYDIFYNIYYAHSVSRPEAGLFAMPNPAITAWIINIYSAPSTLVYSWSRGF